MSGDTHSDNFPVLERLRYFHGQLLGARDFRAEQAYFRDRIRLLTRCLHGVGVVCGLVVEPAYRPQDCPDPDGLEDEARRGGGGKHGEAGGDGPIVRVTPGLAVDQHGDLLVLDHSVELDLRSALSRPDRRRLERNPSASIYVAICYCEVGIEPTRPVVSHDCATAENCVHARVRESVRLLVTLDPPAGTDGCDACCRPGPNDCEPPCLLLAEVTATRDGPPTADTVHNEVRRMLSRHPITTIVGINWWHGASYGVQEAAALATGGFEVAFSRPVRADSLRRGIAEVIVYQGGRGNVGGRYYVTGSLDVPATALTQRLVWKSDSDETFQNGDKVLFRLRGDFVLDECCQPVDAEHVGGRVPPLPEAVEPRPRSYEPYETCDSPPSRPGPWTSGNGSPGGQFESWIYIERDAGEAS